MEGSEHTVAFAAYEGELLGACAMAKTELTAEGKTWCGFVEDVDEMLLASLRSFVRDCNWTGGGEIEMVRALDGREYLIDFNQRFPAWIYGASINGINLPARLFARAVGKRPVNDVNGGGAFVRVVTELRSPFRSPGQGVLKRVSIAAKGHPSGMPELSSVLAGKATENAVSFSDLPLADENAWLESHLCRVEDEPQRLFDREGMCKRIQAVKGRIAQAERDIGIPFVLSYSVKTNPSAQILRAVVDEGLQAECISLAELAHAAKCGFNPFECTLNGPGKWWPANLLDFVEEPARINCDSAEDARRTIQTVSEKGWNGTLIGVRVTAPGTVSRFGIDLSDAKQFAKLSELFRSFLSSSRIGMHYHHAQSTLGARKWVDSIRQAATLMAGFTQANGLVCSHVDLGGGWRSEDLRLLSDSLGDACRATIGVLPKVESFQVEFGKLLVENAGFLVCTVLSLRDSVDGVDLVVSAALSDLPDARSYPHRVLARRRDGGPWVELPPGRNRLLGRICMETDILRFNVSIPTDIEEGDLIAICGAGAYDASMAYSFGRGDLYA